MGVTSEVVVVGGGAAGCAAAYYLARAGLKPTILEREGIGSQASGYSAGGLNPIEGAGIPGPLGPLAFESFRMHLGTWEQLVAESGVDFRPRMISRVHVAFDQSEVPALRATLDAYEAADGFSARWMRGDEVRDLEPRLAQGVEGGLRTQGNAALDSYLYTVALSKAAERHGATMYKGSATGLKKRRGRVSGVVLKGGEIACDAVVLATGPWSAEAGPWLGLPIPVEPLKGEILRMRLPGPPLAHDLSWGHTSLFHRAGGQVWVGTTEERRGFDRNPSDAVRRALLQGAARLMPAMAGATLVRHTACLRPVTPDWLPIVGKAPGWDNLYLATGAGKKGILLSPGIGKAIADLVTEGGTSLPIEPFSPERFSSA